MRNSEPVVVRDHTKIHSEREWTNALGLLHFEGLVRQFAETATLTPLQIRRNLLELPEYGKNGKYVLPLSARDEVRKWVKSVRRSKGQQQREPPTGVGNELIADETMTEDDSEMDHVGDRNNDETGDDDKMEEEWLNDLNDVVMELDGQPPALEIEVESVHDLTGAGGVQHEEPDGNDKHQAESQTVDDELVENGFKNLPKGNEHFQPHIHQNSYAWP